MDNYTMKHYKYVKGLLERIEQLESKLNRIDRIAKYPPQDVAILYVIHEGCDEESADD
jgi:hypothetical protein